MSFPVLPTLVAFCAVGLLWQALDARPASTDSLGGEERYLTHISTEKPIYRAGDMVYVRAVLLHGVTGRPLRGGGQAQMEIEGPKGETVAAGYVAIEDSVARFEWTVPRGASGGPYKVRISHPWRGFAPASRGFELRAYRPPRLKSQIVFLRDGHDRKARQAELARALDEAAEREGDDVLLDRPVAAGEILPSAALVFVRQYAHALRPGRRPGARADFAETLFWHSGLRTDATTGKVTISSR